MELKDIAGVPRRKLRVSIDPGPGGPEAGDDLPLQLAREIEARLRSWRTGRHLTAGLTRRAVGLRINKKIHPVPDGFRSEHLHAWAANEAVCIRPGLTAAVTFTAQFPAARDAADALAAALGLEISETGHEDDFLSSLRVPALGIPAPANADEVVDYAAAVVSVLVP